MHALGDRILMRSRKGRINKLAAVRLPLIDGHAGELLESAADLRHMIKFHLRVHTLHVQVHRQRDNIHIAGPLAVPEKRTLDTVRSGQDAELGITDAAAPVIMRMQRKYHMISVIQVLRHVFHLARIIMRHGKFDC